MVSTRLTFLGLHPLQHAKAWYFLAFGAFACVTPYLPLFYRRWGVSADQVGFINCVRPLVSFCVTPLWGAVADATNTHNAILFVMCCVQGWGYAALSRIPHGFGGIFPYVVALEALCCANNTLADSATGQMCRRARARGETVLGGVDYGDQRLWGAVGWGYVFAPAMGAVLTYAPRRVASAAPFVAVALMLTSAAIASLGMDFSPVDEEERAGTSAKAGEDEGEGEGEGEGERLLELVASDGAEPAGDSDGGGDRAADGATADGVSTAIVESMERGRTDKVALEADTDRPYRLHGRRGNVASRLFVVVTRPDVAATFALFLVMGASMAVTDTFLFLWLDELEGSRLLMGVALCFTCLSEVLVFRFEASIKRVLSTGRCIALILFCYAVRQTFYAILPWFNNPWVVLPIQLLHGITFGLYWSVGNGFVQKVAPDGLNSSVMGVFGACNSGGGFLGALLGGQVYKWKGGRGLFMGCGLINLGLALAVTAATAVTRWKRRNASGDAIDTRRRVML